MTDAADMHPMAPAHLPPFIAAPDGSDFLFTFMAVVTVALIVGLGVLYLTLHSIPERMAHRSNHTQLQVVGILAILALFTHNHLFWVAAILIAAFRMPDFLTPLRRIADTLGAMARQQGVVVPDSPAPEGEAGSRGH